VKVSLQLIVIGNVQVNRGSVRMMSLSASGQISAFLSTGFATKIRTVPTRPTNRTAVRLS